MTGNVPPIVLEPMVVRCKVNATVRVQFLAEDANRDAITFSLPYPRPPLATIGKGKPQKWLLFNESLHQMLFHASSLNMVYGRAGDIIGLVLW